MRKEDDTLLAFEGLEPLDGIEHDVLPGPAGLLEGHQPPRCQEILRADHDERVRQLATRPILVQRPGDHVQLTIEGGTCEAPP